MLSSQEFKEIYSKLLNRHKNNDEENTEKTNNIEEKSNVTSKSKDLFSTPEINDLVLVRNFLAEKFSECKNVFSGLDSHGFATFVNKSIYVNYSEKDTIFKKGDDCNHYYFLVYGDIVLYSDNRDDKSSKLLKTISGGLVFGHKVKDKLQYFAYAQSVHVQLIMIKKNDFDDLIETMNSKRSESKTFFLKKFFPKFRSQETESLKNIKEFFFKFEYQKGSKLFVDGEFDDYIFIIIKGKCAGIKKIKRVEGLKDLIGKNKEYEDKSHIVLEYYGKYFLSVF